ncbi:MAG: hypothetical protein IT379_12775 [Deltaproteobacteria bacterium]|nr:hypothetical protein [Deltaproteobacteria bacterium]
MRSSFCHGTLAAIVVSVAAGGCGSRGPIGDLEPRDPGRGADGGARPPADGSSDAPDALGPNDTSDAGGGAPCTWEPFAEGIVAGGAGVLERDPRLGASSNVVYAFSGEQLYRSEDGGESWTLRSNLPVAVQALAFPENPSDLLVSTNDGVYVSHDEGRSFEPFSLRGTLVGALEVHPAARNRVYAWVIGLGVLRSNDGGETWVPASRGIDVNDHVIRIDGDPRDPDVAIATTVLIDPATRGWSTDGRIVRTTDDGGLWVEIERSVGRAHDLRRCAANPDVLYAAHRFGLLRSEDGGESFAPIDGFPDGEMVFAMDVTGLGCDLVTYVGFPAEAVGMHLSDTDGATFDGPYVGGLADATRWRSPPVVRALSGARVLMGAPSGALLSDDGGRSFAPTTGLLGVGASALVPTEDGHLWLGTGGAGLWVLDRDATRWERVAPDLLPNDWVYSVTPTRGATLAGGDVFVGSWGSLYARRGGGSRFEPVPNEGLETDNVFGMARLADGTWLTASQTDGVQRSEDGGETFHLSNGNMEPWVTPAGEFVDARAILSDPTRDGVVLLGTAGRGIWRSTDGGLRWVPTDLVDESVIAIVYSTAHQQLLALLLGEGIVASEDGIRWTPANEGLASLDVSGISTSPSDLAVYLAAGGRLYVPDARTDEGNTPTWQPFDDACVPPSATLPRIVERSDGRWLVVVSGRDGPFRRPL